MGANEAAAAKAAQDGGQRLAKELTAVDRERKWPNLRPRNAATLILLDHAGPVSKVLMGKRHAGHKFMPGKFVSPGGRIEPADRRMSAHAELHPVVEEKLLKRRPRRANNRR